MRRLFFVTTLALCFAAAGACGGALPPRPPMLLAGAFGPLIIAEGEAQNGGDWIWSEVTLDEEGRAVLAARARLLATHLLDDERPMAIALDPRVPAPRLVEAVLRAVQSADAAARVLIASADQETLELALQKAPSLAQAGIIEDEAALATLLHRPIVAVITEVARIAAVSEAVTSTTAIWARPIASLEEAEQAIELGAHAVVTSVAPSVYEAWRTPPPVLMPLSL